MTPTPACSTRMLLVPADPLDSRSLDLAGEFRAIERELSLAPSPCPIATRVLLAPTLDDLHRALLTYQPHIVHISGHVSDDALWLRDPVQLSRAVSARALAGLLSAQASALCLAVINACDSDRMAAELTAHIACAIGFAQSIDDTTARAFAAAMYRAMATGRSLEHSFRQAAAVIDPGANHRGPRLHCRDGVNPADISCASISALPPIPARTASGAAEDAQSSTQPSMVELGRVIVRRDLVVVAGSGIRTATGASAWPGVLAELSACARMLGASSPILDRIAALIDQGEHVDALSEIETALGAMEFRCAVERVLRDRAGALPDAAMALASLSPYLRAVLTTNLDRTIERAFGGAWPVVARATCDIAQRERVIVKLHGTLEQRHTWILTREQYARSIHLDDALREALAAFFRSRTLLFVGYHPGDPDFGRLLDTLQVPDDRHPPRHYALLSPDPLTRRHHRRMDRAGIRAIFHDATDGALDRTLRGLAPAALAVS